MYPVVLFIYLLHSKSLQNLLKMALTSCFHNSVIYEGLVGVAHHFSMQHLIAGAGLLGLEDPF